jgi:hypothetical protein
MDDEDRENEGDLIIMIFLVFFILISSVGLWYHTLFLSYLQKMCS